MCIRGSTSTCPLGQINPNMHVVELVKFFFVVVNVSVESPRLDTSEVIGSVQIRLLKTNNAVGPVSVFVSTMDGTAQGT